MDNASNILIVAIMFCSASKEGNFVDLETLTCAAVWKIELGLISLVNLLIFPVVRSISSKSISSEIFDSLPVDRLSATTTFHPSFFK